MDTHRQLQALAEKHHGLLRTRDVVAAGLSKASLASFVKEEGYERVCQGIYQSPDGQRDSFYLLQLRCPRTIFSHETALFLQHLTDISPLSFSVTTKTGYNPSHLTKEGIKVYTVKESLLTLGISLVRTPSGNEVRAYDRERTICDMVRSRREIEGPLFLDALRRYALCEEKDLDLLMGYAREFHVAKILQRYLKVLP